MNQYPYYLGDDLGASYTLESTKFRVWAPTASQVSLILYLSAQSSIFREYDMRLSEGGTWSIEIQGDLKGVSYMYKLNFGSKMEIAIDPYAKAATINGERGVVVDLGATNPEGWEKDGIDPIVPNRSDAIIYEAHIRDFTVDVNSGIHNKGRYAGMVERHTKGPKGISTGIDHLLELGITHVHLLPIQDFATVDEALFDTSVSGVVRDERAVYNWGYDPQNYNVPEGSYSIQPAYPEMRIFEFKYLVQKMHESGLKVVLDVVYNHTYRCEDSYFEKIVPGYYYRQDAWGNKTNGSGCGNELATEKFMVKKFVVDSLKYWLKEYHVDGFRFDLMALMGKHTMTEICDEVLKIKPSALIYGEPWTGGESGLDHSLLVYKGSQRGQQYSVFNDHFREAIKGDNDGNSRGFALGGWDREFNLKKGIVGSVGYDQYIQDFAFQPLESLNYVTSHDNLTLWDKVNLACPNYSEEDKIKMCMLAHSIVLTSQGLPFIYGGEEVLKTKGGNHNSYNAGDVVNMMDWSRKVKHKEAFKYIKGLIALRKKHPAFRLKSDEEIRKHLKFLDTGRGVVAYTLSDYAGGDSWRKIAVIYNANVSFYDVYLPEDEKTSWQTVVEGLRSGTSAIKPVFSVQNGNVASVAPLSTMVLYTK